MTPKLSSRLEYRLKNFERAAVNLSWKGSMHPEDHRDIEIAYKKAKAKLVGFLAELERNQKDV